MIQRNGRRIMIRKLDSTDSGSVRHRFGSPEWRRWIAQVIECMETGDYSRFGGKIDLSVNDWIFILNYKDGRLSLDDVERLEKE